MNPAPLPGSAPPEAYEALAATVLAGLRAGDAAVTSLARQLHPAPPGPWALEDARLVVARAHCFRDWDAALTHAADAAARPFEDAVDAVVSGDLARLTSLLDSDATLVAARSRRICCFDPPVHRATLLTYIAANGVEHQRQRTPSNAVEVARALLERGADPNAAADLYGGSWTTMALLVSSDHPARAGLQVALVEVLAAHGAELDASSLRAALAFGHVDAAEALLRLGAEINDLPCAAGLGRADEVDRWLPSASATDRHAALALAAQLGRARVVERLLDAGEDADRYNPAGYHAHATPLHHAALGGHAEVVELLLRRGARTDLRDRTYDSDPAGWARHAGHEALAARIEAGTSAPG